MHYQNQNVLKVGDELIVKQDSQGPVVTGAKTVVLDIQSFSGKGRNPFWPSGRDCRCRRNRSAGRSQANHLVRYGRHNGEDLPARRLPPADRARIRSRPCRAIFHGQRLAALVVQPAPRPGHQHHEVDAVRKYRKICQNMPKYGQISLNFSQNFVPHRAGQHAQLPSAPKLLITPF